MLVFHDNLVLQASGRYPGEPFYKDPIRGDIDFKAMMAEREEAEERAKNPKPGSDKGKSSVLA